MDINFKDYNPRNFLFSLSEILEFWNTFSLKIKKTSFKKIGIFFCFFVFLYFIFIAAPFKFPIGSVVEIEEGMSTQQIGTLLQEKKVIKSDFVFECLVRIFRGDKGVMSGDYFFEDKKDLIGVVYRMSQGIYGLTPTRVTVLEGTTVREMADIFEEKFPEFDKEYFVKKAEPKEGYLFPDTYYFLPNIKADGIINAMENNFYDRIKDLEEEIANSEHTLEEIVVMASILEEEGITFRDRKMISGVLWNRIEIEMPLQVDAVFPYIIGKNTYQVSLDDLKTESEYNTYINKGLPPGPITNPGYNSIVAALQPIESDYLYYLSDRSNNTYYAETFEEHKENKRLYLNK